MDKITVNTIKYHIETVRVELERLDRQKDQYLFAWIKEHWLRGITPNHLTFIRIGIGVVLFILLFNFRNNNGFVIFPLFLIGALTDLLDGAIARCLDMKTKMGEFLDPIADRILLIPIFIYTIIDFKVLLSSIILLELINAGITLFYMDKQIFFSPNIFGKTKMVLQSMVLVAILLFWPQIPNVFFLGILWVSVACMVLSIIFKIFDVKLYYARKLTAV